MVPPLPAAFTAWKISNTAQRSRAWSRSCSFARDLHALAQPKPCFRLVSGIQGAGDPRIDGGETEVIAPCRLEGDLDPVKLSARGVVRAIPPRYG
jgi:hypothetical protein